VTPALVRRIITIVVTLALIAAFAIFVARIPRTVTIFVIAAFIAFGATPLVRRLERRLPRPAAIGTVYLTLLGALVVLIVVIVPVTYAQLASIVLNAPDYVAASQDLVAAGEHVLRARAGNRLPLPSVTDVQAHVSGYVSETVGAIFDSLGSIVLGTVNAFFVGFSALILSVFFVSRGNLLGHSLLEFVPPRKREEVSALFDEIASIFGHFVAGQAFLCGIVGVAVYLALFPVHFSFALLVAVICGITYAVPFVGSIVSQALALALAVPQGAPMMIYVTIAIFIVGRFADNVLVPKIMSDSVGVSPIGVMFSVFAGGELFGLPGLLLGIPAAALAKVLFKYFVQPYIVRMQLGNTLKHFEVDVATPSGAHVDVAVAEPAPPTETPATEIPKTETVTVSVTS
jgi:predicted PurR-regulated permease PerM